MVWSVSEGGCRAGNGPCGFPTDYAPNSWAVIMACRMFTMEDFLAPATPGWMQSLRPLNDVLDTVGDGSQLSDAWQSLRRARPGSRAEDWRILGNVAIKWTGPRSLHFPTPTGDGRRNPWRTAFLYETVAAIRMWWAALTGLAWVCDVPAPTAAGHDNPYGDEEGLRSGGNFIFAAHRESTSRFIFIEFGVDGADPWGRSYEAGIIRFNLAKVYPRRRAGGRTDPVFMHTSNLKGADYLEPAAGTGAPRLAATRRWTQAGCSPDDLALRLDSLTSFVGNLAHEAGHKVWKEVFGAYAGTANQWEGHHNFDTIARLPTGGSAFTDFPRVVSTPTDANRGVTRHWVLAWLSYTVTGWCRNWFAGAEARLQKKHDDACLAQSACDHHPNTLEERCERFGLTGYRPLRGDGSNACP